MRYAILIGINDYERFVELDYSCKDAEALGHMFHRFCHIDEAAIKYVLSSTQYPNIDPWGTFKKIIGKLCSVFVPGDDDLFFYFSGHGVSGSETTVVFGSENHTVTEIMAEIDQLSPKTRILIFDSCHSGSGLPEKERSAQFFSYSTKNTSGYCLLAAAAPNQTAKESSVLKHGKFTYFLMEVIGDRQNYDRNASLDINTLFSKVNTFFSEHPEFKQNPAQQIKTIGSYPIALAIDETNFYVRYDIPEPHNFDWDLLLKAMPVYLDTPEDMAGEFFRYVREHCDNTCDPAKGNAKMQSIEITKNKVALIDDGQFFDLFNPDKGIIAGGGIKTAKFLTNDLARYFDYSSLSNQGINTYIFTFHERSISQVCQLNVTWRTMTGRNQPPIIIDQACPYYVIKFNKYDIIISMLYSMIPVCKEAGERYQKLIYLEFPKGDRIINDVTHQIERYKAGEWVKIRIYDSP